jgi:hypothetical protein
MAIGGAPLLSATTNRRVDASLVALFPYSRQGCPAWWCSFRERRWVRFHNLGDVELPRHPFSSSSGWVSPRRLLT